MEPLDHPLRELESLDFNVYAMTSLLGSEGLGPDQVLGMAFIELGETLVGSIGFSWGPLRAEDGICADTPDAPDWALRFGVGRLHPEYRRMRLMLRLVAALIAGHTADRSCLVTIEVEPKGWQSLKARDRLPAQRALSRHWAQLGFQAPSADFLSNGAHTAVMQVEDFVVPPHLASWGPLTRLRSFNPSGTT